MTPTTSAKTGIGHVLGKLLESPMPFNSTPWQRRTIRMLKKSAALATLLTAPAFAATPPVAPIHPVTTNYWGTPVTDNYRWMETLNSPELAAYMKGQNDYTRGILDSLPRRAAPLKDLTADGNLASFTSGMILAGGKYFYLQTAPGQNTAKLLMRDPATGAVKLLVDPDMFGKAGQTEAINYFQPSMDGKYVAYGVSEGGSEAATLHVLDTTTGADENISIDRVEGNNLDFLPVWWLPDGDFVYYRLQKLGVDENPADHFLKSRV